MTASGLNLESDVPLASLSALKYSQNNGTHLEGKVTWGNETYNISFKSNEKLSQSDAEKALQDKIKMLFVLKTRYMKPEVKQIIWNPTTNHVDRLFKDSNKAQRKAVFGKDWIAEGEHSFNKRLENTQKKDEKLFHQLQKAETDGDTASAAQLRQALAEIKNRMNRIKEAARYYQLLNQTAAPKPTPAASTPPAHKASDEQIVLQRGVIEPIDPLLRQQSLLPAQQTPAPLPPAAAPAVPPPAVQQLAQPPAATVPAAPPPAVQTPAQPPVQDNQNKKALQDLAKLLNKPNPQ